MIKAYPTKWEIVDEAAGLDVGIVKAFDDVALTVTFENTIINSEELLQISYILKQIEDLYKVGLS